MFYIKDLSSSGCSDKNGEGDTFSSHGDLKGQEELPENLKEYKKKSGDDYAKMKEQLQKSTFALRKLISYADKIYGWGFDGHSMNDCKIEIFFFRYIDIVSLVDMNFKYELDVLFSQIEDTQVSRFIEDFRKDFNVKLSLVAVY